MLSCCETIADAL